MPGPTSTFYPKRPQAMPEEHPLYAPACFSSPGLSLWTLTLSCHHFGVTHGSAALGGALWLTPSSWSSCSLGIRLVAWPESPSLRTLELWVQAMPVGKTQLSPLHRLPPGPLASAPQLLCTKSFALSLCPSTIRVLGPGLQLSHFSAQTCLAPAPPAFLGPSAQPLSGCRDMCPKAGSSPSTQAWPSHAEP